MDLKSGIGVRTLCTVLVLVLRTHTYYGVLRTRTSYAAATEWTIASQEIDICQLHLTVAG